MKNSLQKRYGFWTAVSMVIGIVIGSGVFFKAEKVLQATSGNLWLAIFSWLISGSIMIVCAYAFAILAGKYVKVNGIVDYAEVSISKIYGYVVGWFMSVIYYPVLGAVVAWVSANYTLILFGVNVENSGTDARVYLLAIFYLISIFVINIYAPVIACKFQVSTTVIKLIPLVLMAIIGTIRGFYNGQIFENFALFTNNNLMSNFPLAGIVTTAFAYEGWIVATTINCELKEPKKILPRALFIGTIVIVLVYILYFVGLTSTMPVDEFINNNGDIIKFAFSRVFGSTAGSTLFIFVVISCLGTLNGIILGGIRGIYSLSIRNMGPKPEVFSKVNKNGISINSGIMSIILSFIWLFMWYASNEGLMKIFLDFSELPVVTMYALYIPIFIWMIRRLKDLNFIQRFVVPILAIIGSIFMIIATFISHGVMAVSLYIVIFLIIIIVGIFFIKKDTKKSL